jgi:glucose-6-phosphate isomerase
VREIKMKELIEIAERMLNAMKEGHSINPYEYRAVLADAIMEAKNEINKQKTVTG